MLSKVRLFPINSWGTDGYPVLGSPIQLATVAEGETEVNNIRIKLTPTVKSKTLEADDREEVHTAVTGMSGELECYCADPTALAAIFPVDKDSNGNVHFLAGVQSSKEVAIFCEGRSGEKGNKFQMWIYDCTFEPLEEELNTETDNAQTVSLSFNVKVINAGTTSGTRKDRTHAKAYAGNIGYVSGEPTVSDILKE